MGHCSINRIKLASVKSLSIKTLFTPLSDEFVVSTTTIANIAHKPQLAPKTSSYWAVGDQSSVHMRSLYEWLELERSATSEQIRKSYLRLSLRYHPDKSNDPKAAAHLVQVRHAYEVLTDSSARREYDSRLDGWLGFLCVNIVVERSLNGRCEIAEPEELYLDSISASHCPLMFRVVI